MRFEHSAPPLIAGNNNVTSVMRSVLIALVPGVVCTWWYFGDGVLVNLFLCTATALATEATILRMREQPVFPALQDLSAIVTAVLLAVALPPLAPWWIAILGTTFALAVGKHLYGGLGLNPFNPAMVGYVVLIISFPLEMTLWPAPGSPMSHTLGLLDSIRMVFTSATPPGMALDAITMATPLDYTRTQLGQNMTLDEIQQGSQLFGRYAGIGWEKVNLWFLLGGAWLWYRRVIGWQIPVGVLFGLFFMAGVFNSYDADAYPDPLFHLFSGAAMLGAFFIATDPASAASTPRGRIIYGLGIGALIYIIRTWGGYPDAVAFSVLLMNLAAPAIDHFTRPRTFGH